LRSEKFDDDDDDDDNNNNNNNNNKCIQYDMIHRLTAIGLTPGGSGTIHVYTQTIHRTTQ